MEFIKHYWRHSPRIINKPPNQFGGFVLNPYLCCRTYNDEQWKQLTSKDFDIDGIPSYVLVQKDGSYALSNEFRDHNLMVKTLKKLLE